MADITEDRPENVKDNPQSWAAWKCEADRYYVALKQIALLNCSDTCSSQLVEGCECDCHVSIARNAIANTRHAGGIVEAGNTACILRND